MKIEAYMDEMCRPRHKATKHEVHDKTDWMIISSAAAIVELSKSG